MPFDGPPTIETFEEIKAIARVELVHNGNFADAADR
jgi:hypothetical protein